MKNGLLNGIGLTLMRISPIKVIIIDDVSTYFNEQMLSLAGAKGNITFERHHKCDGIMLKSMVMNPRDILIMDIKGTVTADLGKDGFDVVKHIYENTPTFVVVTSAHTYHLKNRSSYGDYIIAERLMTPVDFSEELNIIINQYLEKKLKVYKKLLYRLGKYLTKNITS